MWRPGNSKGRLPFQTQGPRDIDASTEEVHMSDNYDKITPSVAKSVTPDS